MPGWGWLIVVTVALFALDRLCLWMEAKGWIYWRKVKRKGGGGGGLTAFGEAFDPTIQHLEEAREEHAIEEDEEDGDDDAKRKPDDRVG